MNFVREHSPFSNKTERKQSNSRFYFTEDTEEIITNQTLTVPATISNLDKGKCSSDIDIARHSVEIQDISINQNLREINFGDCKSAKSAI